MKTTEENKCGMECIRTNADRSCVKPEKGQCPRCKQLVDECIARIQQLESSLAQVERERDAAVSDLTDSKECDYCKYKELFPACGEENCYSCDKECPCAWCSKAGDGFRWRGVCPENSKEDAQDENA